MGAERCSEYDAIAWLYNRHWQGQFHPTALAVMDGIFLPRLPEQAMILDLCCGPGWLASELGKRGYRITGIDGSAEMLRYARKNAQDARFILDDARSFELEATFDGAFSAFDSLNHLLSIDELELAFNRVFAVLRNGGLFLFDLNTEAGFLEHWHGLHGFIEEDHVCIFQQSFDSQSKIAEIEATLFRLEDGWVRSDFALTQRCYPESEVLEALERTGFRDVHALAFSVAEGLHELGPGSTRAFFLCHKP